MARNSHSVRWLLAGALVASLGCASEAPEAQGCRTDRECIEGSSCVLGLCVRPPSVTATQQLTDAAQPATDASTPEATGWRCLVYGECGPTTTSRPPPSSR